MEVLIAGGSGYIGSTVASACLDAGIDLVILDNLVTGRREFAADRESYEGDITSAEQQGLTNVTPTEILAASGIPPNTAAELGRYEAITTEFLKIANGGTTPTSTSAQAAAGDKLTQAECQAAKTLNIAVNPQFGRLDYSQLQVVSAPSPVTRPAGPKISASPIATAPAC